MKNDDNITKIAKASILCYLLLWSSTLMFLATAGGYTPLYSLMCVVGSIPSLSRGPIRITAIFLVTFSVVLLLVDWSKGLDEQQRRLRFLKELNQDHIEITPTTEPLHDEGGSKGS